MTAAAQLGMVSVIIPTRNRAPLLLQTLRSVLWQQVPLEVIVVDEGSNDGTADTVASLGDERIQVLRHTEPLGVQRARNAGAARAGGPLLAFVDDDDLWAPQKLERQRAALEATSTAWVVGGALTFSAGPRLEVVHHPSSPAETVAQLPYRNAVPGGGSNVMVTAEAFEDVGRFDPSIPSGVEDWDLWVRLARREAPSIVDEPLVAYRRHGGNASRKAAAMLAGARAIEERYRADRGGRPLDWPDLYRWLARTTLLAGDRRVALRLLLASARRGDEGALRRFLRAAALPRPRLAVNDEAELDRVTDRLRPRAVVPWPAGAERWVRAALGEGDGA